MIFLVLSNDLPNSWSSIKTLTTVWYEKELGIDSDNVQIFIDNNEELINNKLDFTLKLIEYLKNENTFATSKRNFKKLYIPYKFFISRLLYKLKNISLFNRHIKNILKKFKQESYY